MGDEKILIELIEKYKINKKKHPEQAGFWTRRIERLEERLEKKLTRIN